MDVGASPLGLNHVALYAIRANHSFGNKTLRIATWNVNSVRQRLDHLLFWLAQAEPDVVCLQEI